VPLRRSSSDFLSSDFLASKFAFKFPNLRRYAAVYEVHRRYHLRDEEKLVTYKITALARTMRV
jgi:hypothetical protein